MKKQILPKDKYDLSYTRYKAATAIGIFAACIWFYFNYLNKEVLDRNTWHLCTVPFRIFCAVWVRNISEQQNRDTFWNPFLAFCFPALTLVVMDNLKKLNLRFEIDTSYSPATQAKELRKFASGFAAKKKYKESAFVYKYIVDNLPYTDADREALIDLEDKINQGIPRLQPVLSEPSINSQP